MGKYNDALNKAGAQKGKPESGKPPPQPKKKAPDEELAGINPSEFNQTAPKQNGHVDPMLITFLEPHAQASETFKLLGSKIVSTNSGQEKRTLMVTSPQPLDGKSTVAANLAVAIAQELNKYAVLIDCDLRAPSLHKIFGLQPSEGMHEYLARGDNVASYLQKTPVSRLSLIQGGKPCANPSELLSSEKMRALIKELRERYKDRFLVADFPPAGFSADSNFLADTVDGILLVARSGKTPKNMIEESVDRIGRDRILGVVFNEDGQRKKGYYKGYYK